jgi:hypothetical protein
VHGLRRKAWSVATIVVTRDTTRAAKQDCKAGDEKTRAECRQEKRDVKQDARDATDEKAAPPAHPA